MRIAWGLPVETVTVQRGGMAPKSRWQLGYCLRKDNAKVARFAARYSSWEVSPGGLRRLLARGECHAEDDDRDRGARGWNSLELCLHHDSSVAQAGRVRQRGPDQAGRHRR